MSKTSERIRVEWKRNDAIRDMGLTMPGGIIAHRDIVYGTDEIWQSLDVYQPADADGPTPVIVSVHGGAWVYGDKNLYRFYCGSLATRGFSVVNFSYRLAPENKYPAQLEDVIAVFHWIEDHAEEYHFDLDHLYALGDSAGAHLLGLYVNYCTNPAYAATIPIEKQESLLPVAVALNCGNYEFDSDLETEDRDLVEDLLPVIDQEHLDQVNVLKYITTAFIPTYVMTAQGDFLKGQALLLMEKLMDHDVPFQMEYYKSDERELGHVFQVNQKCPEGIICDDNECAFFRKYEK